MDSITLTPSGSSNAMQMKVLRTLSFEREPILDDSHSTYLYTHVRASYIATYNPGAVSFANRPPREIAGSMPPQTDKAIRAFIEQPRLKIIVTGAAGQTVLESPTRTLPNSATPPTRNDVQVFTRDPTCDSRNGPILKANSIVQIPGERLWQVHLQVETWINETPKPHTILSNRWSVHSDTNWQQLSTRVYQGIVTVRADMLRNQVVGAFKTPGIGNPAQQLDAFRQAFMAFSVPPGFQRSRIHVQVYPDGNSAAYLVEDTELPFNKSANCPAVRVEIQDSAWMWMGSPGRAMAQYASIAAGAAAQGAFFGGIAGSVLGPAGAVAGGISGGTAGLAYGTISGLSAIAANMPKTYKRVHARAWGVQTTPRRTLVGYILRILTARNPAPALLTPFTTDILIAQDTNNCVDGIMTIALDPGSVGLLASVADFTAQMVESSAIVMPVTRFFANSLGQDPNTTVSNVGGVSGIVKLNQIGAPNFSGLPNTPYNQSGTRGTWLQNLVTQTLEGFDQAPAAVA